jgi:hypothetical protein
MPTDALALPSENDPARRAISEAPLHHDRSRCWRRDIPTFGAALSKGPLSFLATTADPGSSGFATKNCSVLGKRTGAEVNSSCSAKPFKFNLVDLFYPPHSAIAF